MKEKGKEVRNKKERIERMMERGWEGERGFRNRDALVSDWCVFDQDQVFWQYLQLFEMCVERGKKKVTDGGQEIHEFKKNRE